MLLGIEFKEDEIKEFNNTFNCGAPGLESLLKLILIVAVAKLEKKFSRFSLHTINAYFRNYFFSTNCGAK